MVRKMVVGYRSPLGREGIPPKAEGWAKLASRAVGLRWHGGILQPLR
jgi:hypothetical protein